MTATKQSLAASFDIARALRIILLCVFAGLHGATGIWADVAVRAERLYTMAGQPIDDAIVLLNGGKITAIGSADSLTVPDDYEVLSAAVVTPGLVDARSTVGTSGILNVRHDQDQLESSEPIQPELRGIDAYNAHDELVEWVRGFGVTTIHTGHAPGELISGQTIVVKTYGNSLDDVLLNPACAVSVTLADRARKSGDRSPGTRGKMMAMLREQLIRADEYRRRRERLQAKRDAASADAEEADENGDTKNATPPDAPDTDLRLEVLLQVLAGELPLIITADRAQDISNALRLAEEFQIRVWLDSAAESYLLLDEIKQSGVPILLHPTMARSVGERANLSFETASKLADAQILFVLQSGHEDYVPKTRVVLFEAGMAAANGLSFDQALRAITIDAAKLLGVADRVGSIEIGKDADLALYDGDPFEYTTHCTGVIVNGNVVSRDNR